MGSVQILLGRSRWRRRRALPAEALSGIDAWGRPTFLYVTSTQRKRRVVEQEFIGYRGTLCFSPRIEVLDPMLDDLHRRHGRGLALLSPRSEQLVAWRMLAENPGRWPWFDALQRPDAVASALCELLTAMRHARVRDLGPIPRREQLYDALTELDRRLARVPGHMSRAQALEDLLQTLRTPPEALLRWLRSTHSVVLDDILQPTPLVRQVLLALCDAWASAGVHVVMSFESGRDLGGAEVGQFFEYEDLDPVAVSLRPFAITRGLRRAVFDAFVAERGSPVYVALTDRVLRIEPGAPTPDPSPPRSRGSPLRSAAGAGVHGG